MRLLHTSDWHLGQTLHDFDRGDEHQRFLNWLLDTLEAEQIDALLVAGDIFDNPNPSADAQKQFYQFLTEAKRRIPHLDIVIIAGNHDSAGRLEAPTSLLQVLGVTVVGCARTASGDLELDRLITPLRNRQGDIAAWCLAIPFLRPGDVPKVATDGDAYLEGIRQLYRQALDYALNRRENGQAIVALGHCHMHGGQTSEDSERRIVIGGAEALPVDTFDPAIAYAALGHLHRAQQVGGQERVRYSGSPLPMSFSEIDYPHQVVRVDLDGGDVRNITPLPIPRPVALLRIPQQPALIDDVIQQLKALHLPDAPLGEQPYLQVRVRLTAPEPGLRAKVEAALDKKPVRLARIETTYGSRTDHDAADRPQSLDDLGRLQPDDIFKKLYQNKYQAEPNAELLAAFAELLNAPPEADA
ncbi:MAG TPA: exonuclease SbcCD subunit D C-terminal domain-containing protein [Candidatus Competibacteraceae bacterium]|nr:exonuclease SbcCD subunit D C-terminal domain-containing protein [Candidatus Competibacteraceae bacterium]HSA45789.1 exonuclease SbcCD subunit D C-terminal domain-containing protein [Candidatus Competibacteraceae bacterium]